MTRIAKALVGALVVTGALAALNWHLSRPAAPTQTGAQRPLRVGFLPVTCHLTCPVNHWLQKNASGHGGFEPVKFSGWPELKESFLAGETEATFLLAPMAMILAQQGVAMKVVYLGHRDGTALVVHTDSEIRTVADLRGKTIAVPNRFSNQRLIIARALRQVGIRDDEILLKEMPPPDMPAALHAKSVDLICSGEPFMAQAEMDGYGRVLHQARELWPGFISCVLVASQRLIDEEPERLQALVDGIARSGLWLDQGQEQRQAAAQAVATQYYNQDPRLLSFVLAKPPDRVTYSNLQLAKADFDAIHDLALELKVLDAPVAFERYADPRFSERTTGAKPFDWQPPR